MRLAFIAPLALAAGCAATGPTAADPAKSATPRATFDSFKDALARDDYDAAYETLANDTRSRYPSQLFWIAFNMTQTGQRYRRMIAASQLVTAIEKNDHLSAVAVLRAKDPAGEGYEMKSFRLVKENERWLVSFTLQEFFGIPEEQFFDVKQVTAKRDFRHRR